MVQGDSVPGSRAFYKAKGKNRKKNSGTKSHPQDRVGDRDGGKGRL